jgi:ABC-type multidrug transport system permease subunit
MNEIDPTYLIAVRVWWAWCWRAVLLGFGMALLFGIAIGFAGAIIGLDKNVVTSVGGIAGFFIGLFFSIHVMKGMLSKNFGSFRVAVIKQ